jgi:hypothetical protein
VSVLVRSPSTIRVYFLEASRHTISSTLRFPFSHFLILCWWIYLPAHLKTSRTRPIVRVLNLLRQPIIIALGGAGIFNLLAIAYAFQPRLRDRLTQGRRALPWKPWAFGEGDFHSLYRLLMPCIITSMRSSAPYGTPSVHILRSPTAHKICCQHINTLAQYVIHPQFRLYTLVPNIIGAEFLDW